MQVFISYKSEDGNAVRQVVDRLIGAGVGVWFAEYQVLPANYDAFDADVKQNLLQAVRSCSHAIVFSNDRWTKSDYCRTEMQTITEVLPTSRIIEIRIPSEPLPHAIHPSLRDVAHFEYEGNPSALASRIVEHLGISPEGSFPQLRPPPRLARFEQEPVCQLWRYGVRFEPGPFRVSLVESQRQTLAQTAPLISFLSEYQGRDVHLDVLWRPFDTALAALQIPTDGSAPDREVYHGYRKYAKGWEAEIATTIRGLHLFFWSGRSQLALTYASASRPDSPSATACWERRFVLCPRGPSSAERGELNFVFWMDGVGGTSDEQLRTFAALGPEFEKIVESVSYQPNQATVDPINVLSMLAARALIGLACGVLAAYAVKAGGPALGMIAPSFALGLAIGETAVVLYSPLYRQMIWALALHSGEDLFPDAYSRFTANLPHELFGYLLLLPALFIIDLVRTALRPGTLRIPGPGVLWAGLVLVLLPWFGTDRLGTTGVAVASAAAGIAMAVLVAVRFVGYRMRARHWGDVSLR